MSQAQRLAAIAERAESALGAFRERHGVRVTRTEVRISRGDIVVLQAVAARLQRTARVITFERRPCPACGVEHAVIKSGRPWKHRCHQRLPLGHQEEA